jgi:AmmeMemoRadiSam system protein B
MSIPTIRFQKTIFVLFLTLSLFGPGCNAQTEEKPKESAMSETAALTRHPGGAGFWYPANPEDLSQEIDNFIASASDCPPPGKVIALVSPHAGYRYSGPVAAAAFRQVQNRKFDTVVVVGLRIGLQFQDHGVRMANITNPAGKTPGGPETTGKLLAHSDLFEYYKAAHSTRKSLMESGGEHSVETWFPSSSGHWRIQDGGDS